MKFPVRVFLSISVCCLSLSGMSCASSAYRYHDKVYSSPREALAAMEQDLDSVLAQITPSQTPVGGSVVVLTPSDELLLKQWVTPGTRFKPTRAQTDFMLQSSRKNTLFLVEALRRTSLFDKAEWRQSADPDQERFDEDFAVVRAAKSPKWALKTKTRMGHSTAPLETGPASLSLFQQTAIWLRRIEEAARGARK